MHPSIAVDAAGTAYIAWIGAEPNITTLQFCRLPRGATACAARTTIATPGTSITRPFVTVSGNTIRVLSRRYGEDVGPNPRIYLYESNDGGATFPTATPVGSVDFNDAVAHPDGATVSFATDAVTQGEFYQQVPVAPPPGAPVTAAAQLSVDHPYGGAVGLIGGVTPLVVSTTGSSDAQFRRYTGSGDVHDAAN